MKKVLILAYDFPPYVSAGGLRPDYWYKNFRQFGIEPIVVTRQWENKNEFDYINPSKSAETTVSKTEFGTLIEAPYFPNLSNRLLLKHGQSKFKFIRKLISGYYEILQYVFTVGPKKQVYKAAQTYLRSNKVDLIIATGEPFVLFHYANKLSKEFKVKWIADYRDPWSNNITWKSKPLLKSIFKRIEQTTLSSCSFFTTASHLYISQVKKVNPLINGFEIDNGYNESLFCNIKVSKHFDVLTLSHIGSLYEWHPFEIFLFQLNELVNSGMKFHMNFYGLNFRERVENSIKTKFPKLLNCVTFFNKVPNEEIVQKMAESNVLILFNYYQFIGTKVFDYLASKRKILLLFENDKEANALKEKHYHLTLKDKNLTPQADLIKETNSGVVVRDQTHFLEVMHQLQDEFSITGDIACNSTGIEKYSRKHQTGKLAKLILNTLETNS